MDGIFIFTDLSINFMKMAIAVHEDAGYFGLSIGYNGVGGYCLYFDHLYNTRGAYEMENNEKEILIN